MKVKLTLTILGAKSFNDSVDGNDYDTTKLIIPIEQKPNATKRLNNVGFESIEVPFLTSAEYEKHKLGDLSYPHQAECDVEITNKGMTALSYKFIKKLDYQF